MSSLTARSLIGSPLLRNAPRINSHSNAETRTQTVTETHAHGSPPQKKRPTRYSVPSGPVRCVATAKVPVAYTTIIRQRAAGYKVCGRGKSDPESFVPFRIARRTPSSAFHKTRTGCAPDRRPWRLLNLGACSAGSPPCPWPPCRQTRRPYPVTSDVQR